MRLFPLLSDHFSAGLIVAAFEKDPSEISKLIRFEHPKMRLSEFSGNEIDLAGLQSLRCAVMDLAIEFGFPSREGSRFISFDKAAADLLYELVDAPLADARSKDLWNFLTCVVLLDVASWRFENSKCNPKFNRYLGSPKNTFSRLWWRAYALGELSHGLGEDNAVALMERTSLSGDKIVAREIVSAFEEVWSGAVEGGLKKESDRMLSFRKYAYELRALGVATSFSSLTPNLMNELFVPRARAALGLAESN